MKDKITREEYYQVCGLLALAKRHADAMGDITSALRGLLAEDDPTGWVSDAVFGAVDDYSADDLLKKMKIEVADGPQG